MSKKLRNIWLLVFFAIGCSAQWDPPTPEPERPSQHQQGVLNMPTTYAGNNVFPSAITIPSDGDNKPAASVNVSLEGLADRTTWLEQRVNDYFTYVNFSTSGGDPVSLESWSYSVIAGTWTKSAYVLVNVTGVEPDDEIRVKLHVAQAYLTRTATTGGLISYRVMATDQYGGASPTDIAVGGSAGAIETTNNSQGQPLSSLGKHVVTLPGTTRLTLEVRLRTAVADFGLTIYSPVVLEAQLIKAP